MRDVAVIGVGMHKFGKFLDLGIKDLGRVAIWNAIKDANIDPRDIECAYVGNAMAGLITGQECIRGQLVLREAGIGGIPVVNVENACASSSTSFREAYLMVAFGLYDVALAVGVEKLYCGDTATSIKAMASASDVETMGNMGFQFTANYAMGMKTYMAERGLTREHLAKITVKNKYHGSLNPYAQYQKPMTIEEVLNSRMVADPLTLYMCSTMGDGAAAVILCSAEKARKYTSKALVYVVSSDLAMSRFTDPRKPAASSGDDEGPGANELAVKAYEKTGIGPEDIDVVEVHDAMAPAEIQHYESLGFVKKDDIAKVIEEKQTWIHGDMPFNSSGGLAARGHPVGATGAAQVIELVWQLRGEAGPRQVKGRMGRGPKVGMAQNNGGRTEDGSAVTSIIIVKR